MRRPGASSPLQQRRTMGRRPGHVASNAQRLDSMSPWPARMTRPAGPKRSRRSRRRPDGRRTTSRRCRIAGAPSNQRFSPPAGSASLGVRHRKRRPAEPEPSSEGHGAGASARRPALARLRTSRPGQRWKARRRVVCPAAALLSGRGGIAVTLRSAKRPPSAACHRGDQRATRWTTSIWSSSPHALPLTGRTPGGLCGTKAGASTAGGPTPPQECVCFGGWRKPTTGAGLQHPDSPPCRSSRRCSPAPWRLRIV